MNIRVLDFGILTKHYIKYQEGVSEIKKLREDCLKEIKLLETKINSLISINSDSSEIGIYTEMIYNKEEDLKIKINEVSQKINLLCYEDISEIIQNWALLNNVDLALSSSDVAFCKKELDSTDDILEILKDKNLFVD